ncbi:SRPBCC domain-containing protein [Kribbella sp. NPDC049227]|uniref:SRPBCC domain-containing protein n=1 Tax=Kribbella sp. NPDC049227 TaxID=3364113 RepID=UPI003712CEF6
MNVDRIERDTLIAASLERVWSLVSEPGFWITVEKDLARIPADEGTDFPVVVAKSEPPTYVAYRWASQYHGEDVRDDNSTLVEFTLSREGDKTRLRVVESGFAALSIPPDKHRRAVEGNTEGWTRVLGALRTQFESTA